MKYQYLPRVSNCIARLSEDFKELFYKMVLLNPQNRPNSIDEILNSPWMKEINNLNDEKKLEREVYKLFKN